MFPNEKVELLIARFTYVSHIHPLYPLITFTRKRHSPSGSMTVIRDWFDRIINAEKVDLPPSAVLKFAEYRILSGNADLFKIEGSRFDKVLLIIGEQNSYWVFYENMPLHRRIEGKASLPISFCVCCFHSQYLKIMKTLKTVHYDMKTRVV